MSTDKDTIDMVLEKHMQSYISSYYRNDNVFEPGHECKSKCVYEQEEPTVRKKGCILGFFFLLLFCWPLKSFGPQLLKHVGRRAFTVHHIWIVYRTNMDKSEKEMCKE